MTLLLGGVDCFYDANMAEILGEFAQAEGSQLGGSPDGGSQVAGLGMNMKLRIVWCWRKVHVVYTLIKAGSSKIYNV